MTSQNDVSAFKRFLVKVFVNFFYLTKMARFRRYYRRLYGRRAYRRFRRVKRRYRRFANGSSRSRVRVKMQQRLTFETTIPANATYPVNCLSLASFYNNQTLTGAATGCMKGGCFAHELFYTYSQLYSQFRLEGMKVNFAVTNPIGAGADFSNLSVYCNVERQTQSDDFQLGYNPNNPTAPHYPLPLELVHSANTPVAMAVNNSITRFQRQVWASDLLERCTFVDCGTNVSNKTINGQSNQATEQLNDDNPAFSPTLFFTVATSDTAGQARQVNFLVDVTYYVQFRNPKYAAGMDSIAKGGSRILPAPAGGSDAVIDMDGQDDMDDGPGGDDGPPETRSGRILGAAALGGAAVVGAAAAAVVGPRGMDANNATQDGEPPPPPRLVRGSMDDDGSVRRQIRVAWQPSASGRHGHRIPPAANVFMDPDGPVSEN